MDKRVQKSGTTDGMIDSFKKATTEMLVLFLLLGKPMYVYQMIQELDKLSHSAFSFATLYPAIYRLQKFNYLQEYEKCISDDNRVRRYYSITENGIEHLQELRLEYCQLIRGIDDIFSTEKGDKNVK